MKNRITNQIWMQIAINVTIVIVVYNWGYTSSHSLTQLWLQYMRIVMGICAQYIQTVMGICAQYMHTVMEICAQYMRTVMGICAQYI